MARKNQKILLHALSTYNAWRIQEVVGLLENIESLIVFLDEESKNDFYEVLEILKNLKTYNSGDW